jgi:RNA polymerase sigma-70 factor (ECF subfamily)
LSVTKEARLIARAQQGDQTAMSHLYRQNAPKIYGYIASQVGDPALAEDLTSEVFLRALEGLPQFEYRGISFSAWLHRIAHDRVVDYFRQQARRPTLPLENGILPAQNGVEGQVEAYLHKQRLDTLIHQLTTDQQQVLVLRFNAGLKLQEVAYAMDKSVGAIKMLQLRALERLRQLLEQAEQAPTEMSEAENAGQ